MGGSMDFHSEEGVGSLFSFTVFVPVILKTPKIMISPTCQDKRILFVESSLALSQLIQQRLIWWGMVPCTVESIASAPPDNSFDLMIVDWRENELDLFPSLLS